jgi:flagellar biosynthesis regulator FlbT
MTLLLNEPLEATQEIEMYREQLVRLVGQYGFLHPEVVQCSERLDKLLLEYMGRKL